MSAAKTPTAQPKTSQDAVQADYHLEVALQSAPNGEKKAVLTLPDSLRLHKTVHYWTRVPGAKVVVEFEKDKAKSPSGLGSPYLTASGKPKMTVTSKNKPLELCNKGKFFAECYIERQVMNAKLGKMVTQKIGYYEGGGGNHVVK